MGASKSSELDSQRIAEIATEANGQFSKDFSAAFKQAVIAKIKRAYLDGSPPSSSHLLPADVPSQNIKQGVMTKIGANVKSWKKRYFVAKNKADNYVIIYYEDELMTKEKGRFCCCGYQVQVFSGEEAAWHGGYGIKLSSFGDEKRQWLFRAPSEQEQAEWIEVFMNACRKSQPEPVKDSVYADAFKVAFRLTKAAYGYFGVCYTFGTEYEMLEHLTNQVLKREILDDFITRQSKSSPSQAKAIALSVHNDIRKIVKPIVMSTWRSSYEAAETMKASFELTVKASLRVLLDNEQKITNYLRPKIDDLVQPYLPDYQSVICEPLLSCCFDDILAAYEQALFGFHAEMHKILHSVDRNANAIRSALKTAERVVDATGGPIGPLTNSHRILWVMHTDHLLHLQETFEECGMRGYDVYSMVMDDLRVLLRNAIATFSKVCFPLEAVATSTAVGTSTSSTGEGTSPTGGRGVSIKSTGAESGDVKIMREQILESIALRKQKADSEDGSPKANGALSSATAAETKGCHRSNSPPTDRSVSRSQRRSVDKTQRPQQRHNQIDMDHVGQVLLEVCIRLGADAKQSLHRTLAAVLVDAMESRVQETIIAQCYDEVLSAEQFVTRETRMLINLESLGEKMVRDFIRQFAQTLAAEHMGAATDSRLDFAAAAATTAATAASAGKVTSPAVTATSEIEVAVVATASDDIRKKPSIHVDS